MADALDWQLDAEGWTPIDAALDPTTRAAMDAIGARVVGRWIAAARRRGVVTAEGAGLHYSPERDRLYLLIDDATVELTGLRQGEAVRVVLVDAIGPPDAQDPDARPAQEDVTDWVLGHDYDGDRVTALTLYAPWVEAGALCCEALRLTLARGRVIFVDPTYYWGLCLGGAEQRAIWLDNRWRPGAPAGWTAISRAP